MNDARALDREAYGEPWIESVGPYLEFWLAAAAAAIMFLATGGTWRAAPWEREMPLSADPALAILGLILIVATYVLRAVRTGQVLRFQPIDIPLYAFAASAGVGVWAAWERDAAIAIFLFLIAGITLYHAVRAQPGRAQLLTVLVFWALFGVVFSIAFLYTTDWQTYADKIPYVNRLTVYLRRLIPARAEPFVNSNDAGGILALVLPAFAPLIAYRRELPARGRKPWTAFWVLAALVVAAGWVLSLSRGAWAGLLVTGVLWGVWRGAGGSASDQGADRAGIWRHQVRITAIWVVVALVLTGVVGALVLIGVLPGTATLNNRLNLWDSGMLLARDYRVFGAGLGAFAMHYSLYTLLINVGYIFSSHNLVVDLLVEQGAIGLVAAAAFAAGTFVLGLRSLRRAASLRSQGRLVVEASLVALFAILLHGAVQNVFYGSPAGMLLAVPLGLIANPRRHRAPLAIAAPDPVAEHDQPYAHARWVLPTLALVVLIALGLGVWQRDRLAGIWHANLGAVAQARAELTHYEPGWDGASLDAVRRMEILDEPMVGLERAVQADPANVTARLRLANIALSRGNYPQALEHAQAAWDAGHRDRVTRLLYGDALVAAGRPEEAAECVKGVPFAVERLQEQGWERYYADADFLRAANAWYTVMLLDPEDPNAPYWYAEARALLGEDE